MSLRRVKVRRHVLLASTAIAASIVAFAAGPACAFATQYAHAQDGSATYDNIAAAWNAASDGTTIVMDSDWNLDGALVLAKGKSATIKLDDHKISRGLSSAKTNGGSFYLCENATLNLVGSKDNSHEFSYEGYNTNGKHTTQTITSGGLVTGGYSSSNSGGITVSTSAKLNLENVAVAGNRTDKCSGAGVFMCKDSSLSMTNAKIEHNRADKNGFTEYGGRGGGVYVKDDDVTITLNASSISNNLAEKSGGAIASDGSSTKIELKNGSQLANNYADSTGGAIWLNYSLFSVTGDGSSKISGNASYKYGGGIYIESRIWGTNDGKIDNLTFEKNEAGGDFGGGAIYSNQENLVISNCTITGNTATRGGGISVTNDNNTVRDCTITGNIANGKTPYGGGIYVESVVDLNIGGKLVVKDNKSEADGKRTDNNVYLDHQILYFWTSRAYLKGNVAMGSQIGLSAGEAGKDRCMGKDMDAYVEGTFFSDDSTYHLTSGSGELWRRQGTSDYLVTVDGQGSARYNQGLQVYISVPSANGNKVFWRWDTDKTTGLSPISSIITDVYNPFVRFDMPQNDVHLKSLYADRVTKGLLIASVPVAGKQLPLTATFQRTDSGTGGTAAVGSVPVTWYEVADDGSKTVVAGTAKPGTTYVASASVQQDAKAGLFFSQSIAASDIYVEAGAEGDASATAASVDSATGTLTIETSAFKTTGTKPDSSSPVKQTAITVNMQDEGVHLGYEVAVPNIVIGNGFASGSMQESAGTDSDRVSVYAQGDGSFVICAPVREGMNFNHWEGVPAGVTYDDVAGTVTFSQPMEGVALTAVYTPKATEVDLGMSAPVAGEKLSSTANALTVACTDGQNVDLKAGFSPSKDLDISWTPQSSSTKAAYLSSYTATIALDDATGYVGVEDVLAANATVKANGVVVEGARATFALKDGKLCLVVSFASTGAPAAKNVAQPQEAQVSYEDATALTSTGSSSTIAWGLPKATVVTVASGQSIDLDIDWEVPTGFNASKAKAQTLTARGILEIPAWLENASISSQVTAKVKVAAPADKTAAKAVKGKTKTVKAAKKTGKTAKVASVKIKTPASATGTSAKLKVVSKSSKVKVNKSTGKVTLKKGAKKGKVYKAKIKVTYGKFSKTVTVKFKVK